MTFTNPNQLRQAHEPNTTHINSLMNESEFAAKSGNRCQARERHAMKSCLALSKETVCLVPTAAPRNSGLLTQPRPLELGRAQREEIAFNQVILNLCKRKTKAKSLHTRTLYHRSDH